MKFLFVSIEAITMDLANIVRLEGHDVKYYIYSKYEKDVGDGFVEKVDSWKEYVDWADVIVFDDIGFREADNLRAQGKKVVGGGSYTDKLEDDREFGQKELADAGVTTLPSQSFTSFDDAIKYVEENPDRYVIKPSGKVQNEKELLFVGQEPDGKDVIDVLTKYKKNNWANKIKVFLLQKHASGVEVAVGAFFNGRDFVYPINVNFEHKKLFPGDIGPSTGEMGCYDDQTEVLTDNGWKLFKDLGPNDKICTLNPDGHIIEFNKPESVVCYNHHKKLLSIKNRAIDIAVTLDHNMYVCSQQNAKNGGYEFEFVKARDLGYQSLIKRSGVWIGVEQETFVLPSVPIAHHEGRAMVLHEAPAIEIPMDDWLAFTGIWLANGSVSEGYKISVAQKKPAQTEKIERLLSRLPFKFAKNGSEFYCYSKQLHSYLAPLGKSFEKFVPRFVKDLSPRQIEIFLEWLAMGDGTMMKNGFRIFCTSSERLGGDIQELLLKIGRMGNMKVRDRYGPIWIKDHFANRTRRQYEVIERVRKVDSWIDKRDMKIIDYDGKVYCATVKNHIMYVRRGGKPYWCGNTSMFWTQGNKMFDMTLAKMKDKLAASGYVGYVDINCIANSRGVYPLEFTSRFGIPHIQIACEGVLSKWGEFLHDIASGKETELKVKKGFQIGVVIAVPPFPFDDIRTFKKHSEGATIIFKRPNLDGIHIGEVKKTNGDWHVAGSSGYVVIVTGSGSTMEDAIKQAYNRVDGVKVPNMYYRTDIGERWTRDSDVLHAWGYLY